MKFSIPTIILGLAVNILALPSPDTETEEIGSFMTGYEAIVNWSPSIESRNAVVEERCCNFYSPCCDASSCTTSVDTCYENCATIPGAGAAGCVLGCLTACG